MSVFDVLDKKIMSLRFGRPDVKSIKVINDTPRRPLIYLIGRRTLAQFRSGRTRI